MKETLGYNVIFCAIKYPARGGHVHGRLHELFIIIYNNNC